MEQPEPEPILRQQTKCCKGNNRIRQLDMKKGVYDMAIAISYTPKLFYKPGKIDYISVWKSFRMNLEYLRVMRFFFTYLD